MNLTKGLKQALACAGITALSFAAYGLDWVAEDFESDYYSPSTPVENKPILGTLNTAQWTADGGDVSMFEPSDLARLSFTACNTPMSEKVPYLDNYVMALNTEGATLTRKLADVGGVDMFADFSADPVYVDMMVKFVLSEDQPDPPSDLGVKALIYANASSNLVVFTGNTGTREFTTVDAVVDPEQWYRLTIKWFYWQDGFCAAFTVTLNGIELNVSDGYIDDGLYTQPGPVCITASQFTLNSTLTAIEFQGTGYIDELVVTDVEPDIQVAEATYFAGTGTQVDATAYATWQDKFSASIGLSGSQGVEAWMLNAFLLNVDPGTTETEARIIIKKITPTTTGADVLLKAIDGNGSEVAFDSPYGTLKLWKTPSLEVPFGVDSIVNPAMSDEYPIDGAADKYFFKASIE